VAQDARRAAGDLRDEGREVEAGVAAGEVRQGPDVEVGDPDLLEVSIRRERPAEPVWRSYGGVGYAAAAA
jgi:hypothetical protein